MGIEGGEGERVVCVCMCGERGCVCVCERERERRLHIQLINFTLPIESSSNSVPGTGDFLCDVHDVRDGGIIGIEGIGKIT